MFERFVVAFPLTGGKTRSETGLRDRYGGCTFGGGIYRVHDGSSAELANDWVDEAFPKFAGVVSCFGFDWLGRQFAVDYREPAADPGVLLFEPGTGEVLEVTVPYSRFHDEELVDQSEAALAHSFFEEARAAGLVVGFTTCAGYRVPLFLGGRDDLENLHVIDLDVYWTLHAQLIRQFLPP